MSTKTENHELSRRFLWQIGLVTLIVIAAVVYTNRYLTSERSSPVADTQTIMFPWLVAGRHTIENALYAFSGNGLQEPKIPELARALTALLVSSVICPTVFLLGWRWRRLTPLSGENPRPLSLSISFYGLCAAVTLYSSVAMIPVSYYGEVVRTSLRAAQAVQSNRDSVISEVNTIAINAFQYYILPTELGGGDRSYEEYIIPQGLSKTSAARYSVAPSRKEVMIRAASAPFEDCSVEVRLDSTGRLWQWTYSGRYR
jgi:hypothetical protein